MSRLKCTAGKPTFFDDGDQKASCGLRQTRVPGVTKLTSIEQRHSDAVEVLVCKGVHGRANVDKIKIMHPLANDDDGLNTKLSLCVIK